MTREKVITNYSNYTDANLDVLAGGAVKSLTANAYYSFTNGELTTLTTVEATYHSKLVVLATGGTAAVIEKNAARTDLLTALNVIGIQVNLQANGDLIKLQSTGLPLVKQREHRVQSVPGNLHVGNGNGSDLIVSVDKSPAGDNGTVFACTPVTNTVTDPNLWTLKLSNGHAAMIKGLTSGIEYKVTAAYKGNDNDDLVWAPPITKFAGN